MEPPPSTTPPPARIAHLSDVHFGRIAHPEVVAALVDEVNGAGVDLVALSGDLTQRARRREFAAARAMIDAFDAPVIVVPGNHDVRAWWHNPVDRVWRSTSRFRRFITAERVPGFDGRGVVAAGINSAHGLTVKGGRIRTADLAAMEARFADAPAGAFRILVVHHHLLRLEALGEHDVSQGAHRALDAARRAGVDLILCGHLHRSHVAPVEIAPKTAADPDGHTLVVASAGTATSSRGRADDAGVNLYNWVTVGADTFTVAERRFDPDAGVFRPERETTFVRNGRAPPVCPAEPMETDAACLNCGHALGGPYCAGCGQKAEVLRLPAHRLVRDAAVEAVGYDGRVWRTLATLVFRPGALTTAYFEGRRQLYLRPVRVYLTSTLAFFFLLSTIDPVGRVQAAVTSAGDDSLTVAARTAAMRARLAARPDSGQARFVARFDSLGRALGGADSAGDTTVVGAQAALDSLGVAVASPGPLDRRRARAELALLGAWPPDSVVSVRDLEDATAVLYPDTSGVVFDGPAWISRAEAIQRWRQSRTAGERRDALAGLARSAIGHVPTVMFLLLPLFALVLKALYARRGRYYAEHIVFGLHTHAFAFVVFAAVTLLAWAGPGSDAARTVTLVLFAAIPVYFLLAQKRVYGQTWRKTLAKAVLLGTVYYTALLFGLVAVIVLAAVAG